MKICVLGKGFVGSAICKKLEQKYDLTVFASSKEEFKPDHFDIVINCAGEARRYKVEEDFFGCLKKEDKVIEMIQVLGFLNPDIKVVHLSSICAENKTPYGELKLQIEISINQFPNNCILRLGGLIGEGLRKNVIFDWLNGKPIRVSKFSVYNFISTAEVANIVEYIINNFDRRFKNQIMNIAASQPIVIKDVFALRKNINVRFIEENVPCEIFNINTDKLQEFYSVKTSEEYIKEFLQNV